MAVIGGGAAGFFGAINAAQKAKENNIALKITIFESGSQYLKKVRISGGGRCNVTHNLFDVNKFCENYPRGQRELRSPMQRFQAQDTLDWFSKQGVKIVAEDDGRMFPESNSSETIISTYLSLAEQYNIQTLNQHPIKSIQRNNDGSWNLQSRDESLFTFNYVLIATGSSPAGYKLAESLGHTITDRAPSLFSFKISNPLLYDLQGISFHRSQITLTVDKKKKFKQQGPTLITHWGLSGPAILKLSAWAAREMKLANYKAQLTINWVDLNHDQTKAIIEKIKTDSPKTQIKNTYPDILPKRFWLSLLKMLSIEEEKQWANITKKEVQQIINNLIQFSCEVQGQNRFKDEFVECGGISSKEINFKSMESKIAPGVYFAGEILDVDGITGGFNFQNAWTTSWIAAQDIASKTN